VTKPTLPLTPGQIKKIAIDEVICRLDRLEDYEAETARAAQLLDFVIAYRFLLPSNPEFERLMLEHIRWVDKQRAAGRLPASEQIPRAVREPKARKSLITGNTKGKRK
jgi:hypothetical protein